MFSGSSVHCEGEQPPRPASVEPEARHAACFFRRKCVPRLDPAPRRKRGGRDSKRGEGRRLPLVASVFGGVCFGFVDVFVVLTQEAECLSLGRLWKHDGYDDCLEGLAGNCVTAWQLLLSCPRFPQLVSRTSRI